MTFSALLAASRIAYAEGMAAAQKLLNGQEDHTQLCEILYRDDPRLRASFRLGWWMAGRQLAP